MLLASVLPVQHHVLLTPFNTLGVAVRATHFLRLNSLTHVYKAIRSSLIPDLILGGGSNILLTHDIQGVVWQMNLRGIQVISEDANSVVVEAAAGENWDQFVAYCVAKGWGGLENLSLIPGTVGASPIQNIGAYGVEMQDSCEYVDAIGLDDGVFSRFSRADCAFSYRDSIFKQEFKNQFIITAVAFRLQKKPILKLDYNDVQQTLLALGHKEASIGAMRDAIIHIRQQKLPDPRQLGNAGSFFKNPLISQQDCQQLLIDYPKLPHYPQENGQVKLAAGWLIEQAGWKGKNIGQAGMYAKQALILVNHGGATGADLLAVAQAVQHAVQLKFRVHLEIEPVIV